MNKTQKFDIADMERWHQNKVKQSEGKNYDWDLTIKSQDVKRPFTSCLTFGKTGESLVADLVSEHSNVTVEVKTDTVSDRTGNIYIEYQCRGQPSGIAKTKADWYAYITPSFVLMLPTEPLKDWLRTKMREGKYKPKNGGDYNKSVGLLIPINDLVSSGLLSDFYEKGKKSLDK